MTSPYLPLAVATLEDLKDDFHRRANKAFFTSHFVSYGDHIRAEATIANCLTLLRQLDPCPVPAAADGDTALAS